jgi:hypothetical protein
MQFSAVQTVDKQNSSTFPPFPSFPLYFFGVFFVILLGTNKHRTRALNSTLPISPQAPLKRRPIVPAFPMLQLDTTDAALIFHQPIDILIVMFHVFFRVSVL